MAKKAKAKPRKKTKRKVVTKVGKGLMTKKYKQTGSSVKAKDRKLKAKKPGWRKSKKTGKPYHEVRANRSDKNAKTKL